jgi:hypothetical protein
MQTGGQPALNPTLEAAESPRSQWIDFVFCTSPVKTIVAPGNRGIRLIGKSGRIEAQSQATSPILED